MSYCSNSDVNNFGLKIPSFPRGENCEVSDENGTKIYLDSTQNTKKMREELLKAYEEEFNRILRNSDNKDLKHSKVNCLIGKMLENVHNNYDNANLDTSDLDNLISNEEKYLEDQHKIMNSNENSDLVSKYRNESSEKRMQGSRTKFTVLVSLIVVFLILEGILFFA
jgi:hypothetical protein